MEEQLCKVGTRCNLDGYKGTIRYIGSVPPTEGKQRKSSNYALYELRQPFVEFEIELLVEKALLFSLLNSFINY